MALSLILAVICVLANAYFVASEFALVKVRESCVAAQAQRGDAKAQSVLTILRDLDSYLSVCQLGVTLASLGLGWVGEPAVGSIIGPLLVHFGVTSPSVVHAVSLTTAFVIITLAHIILGEQTPKMLAIYRAEAIALHIAAPMRMFRFLVYPFLLVVNGLSNLLLRAFGVSPSQLSKAGLPADEIRLIVAAGQIDPQKRDLMERVLQGTDRPVRAIMVPRVDMAFLSALDTPNQLLDEARRHGYSRLPLVEGRDPDKILGYIYVKDLIVVDRLPAGGVAALRRDVLFVPETRKVGDVLLDFQRSRIPLAIVVDEYGGTSGLVTVEDIVEEIVGDLQDELDVEGPQVVERPDGTLILDGLLPTSELSRFGIDVAPVEGHDTVGGYVVAALGRLARPGDAVRLGRYDATVEDVRRRRVTRVRLVMRPISMAPPKNQMNQETGGVSEDGVKSKSGTSERPPKRGTLS